MKKFKDYQTKLINIKIKFKNISKLKLINIIRLEANIEYLFLLPQPTKNNSIVKTVDITPINKILYSISNKLRFGPQIKLIQNK